MHNFSDVSELGYEQCSYLKVVDENENIHCSLIMGKARVAPKTFVSIPRLELLAAVLSVENIKHDKESYSCKNLVNISGLTAGLCWGTLLMIREHSRPLLRTYCTWYKKTAISSSGNMSHQRGILQITLQKVWILKNFVNIDRWFQCPKFLWKPQSS